VGVGGCRAAGLGVGAGGGGEGAAAAAVAAGEGYDGRGGDLREVFENLKVKLKEISALQGVQSLLTWDQQVYMPVNGVTARGEQQAVIARVVHAHQTDEELGAYLQTLMAEFEKLRELGFSQLEIASVREAARDYNRTRKKPVELAARAAKLEATGVNTWQKARKEKDFSLFAPVLQEWIDIIKQEAAAVEPISDVYDFCLDKFERGASTKRLDPFFASIKTPLISLVRQIHKTRQGPNRQFLQSKDLFSGTFSLETQKRLARRFSEELGFEFNSGRFDESVHPMTINIMSPSDVRITSRFSETELSSGILATLHETGHGLYEQGRNAQACKEGLPVSRPPGMGMHESQSLLWEKQVGMSAEYWEHYWPIILRSFSSLPHSEFTEFHKVINEIKPSFIRVSADEVSYPLHILLRYEIEKGLLHGSLQVADVPAVWNQKMEEYLGIVPQNDAEGCLQDIHWGIGLFGYFPTYTLGAVYAAMLFQAAEKEIPELRKCIKEGKFKPLREWLREKIHTVGSLYETADELVEKVTGSKLDASCFLNYLSNKYGALYNLSSAEVDAVTIGS
jgi:carboxypeptidase Taq